MNIPFQHIKYIAVAAAAVLIVAFAADRYSSFRQATLEKAVAASADEANKQSLRADALETEAAAYRAKIAYLENQISQIGEIARKQDEEIKLHARRADAARGDVDRSRSIRTIDATADELCKKLAELGHGCE